LRLPHDCRRRTNGAARIWLNDGTLPSRSVGAIRPPTDKRNLIIFDQTDRRFAVRVYATGRKVWIVQYRSPVDGKDRRITLGTWPTMQADEARTAARVNLNKIDGGECPYSTHVAQRGTRGAGAGKRSRPGSSTGVDGVRDFCWSDETRRETRLWFEIGWRKAIFRLVKSEEISRCRYEYFTLGIARFKANRRYSSR
jgi:hypothetical protein